MKPLAEIVVLLVLGTSSHHTHQDIASSLMVEDIDGSRKVRPSLSRTLQTQDAASEEHRIAVIADYMRELISREKVDQSTRYGIDTTGTKSPDKIAETALTLLKKEPEPSSWKD